MNHPPFLLQLLQGALIGLGAVLPGISGGVLSVVFGIYKPLMELISNPKSNLKTQLPVLFPYLLGSAVGFLGIASLLAFFLEKYPAPSVCLFIGLITGMLPSLLREAAKKGRNRNSCLSLLLSMTAVFLLLGFLKAAQLSIQPNFVWYLFCGFCLALSIIAPGMSFSTLLCGRYRTYEFFCFASRRYRCPAHPDLPFQSSELPAGTLLFGFLPCHHRHCHRRHRYDSSCGKLFFLSGTVLSQLCLPLFRHLLRPAFRQMEQ